MDELSPLNENPYDSFDDQDVSPVAPIVTQDNDSFGSVSVQPEPEPSLYDTFDVESQPQTEDEDGGWFNWFSSNVEGINQQESSTKVLKAAAEKEKTKPKGVFGESFGILSPDERQVWINETRSGAEESVKSWQTGLARTQKFLDEKGANLNPQTRQAVLRNLQAGQAELLKAQQELRDIQDVEAGRKPAATLTGWRSSIESGAQGLIDDVAAGIVKAAGLSSSYLSQGDLPQQQLMRAANATWGKVLGDEKMASMDAAPDENAVYKVGELITEFAKKQFPGDEARQREFSQVLSRGAGNMIGFYGTAGIGALLKGGQTGMFLLTSALGAGVGASHQFEDATKARERGEDVSELDRLLSFMSGAALGATEAIPIMRSFAGGRGGVVGALTRGAETSAEEAFQEGFQQIGQNLTAQQLYDPKRKITEGVEQGIMAGGILGFLGGAGVQSIIRPREFDPFKDLPQQPEIIDDGQSVTTTRPLPETAPETPTEAPPEGKRGVDVIQFIRAKGGLKPSGELDAVDAKRYPGLVSSKGLTADQMREALVEAGYLEETGPDQPAVTTPQDVYDLVGRAISGERIVPAADVQAEQDFANAQVARDFDQEIQAAEQNFVLPEIEAIDAEAGFPVLTEAYAKLNESERAEVVERNARGEDIGDLIEEIAVRNDDRQTIAAMAIRKGLNDQQIGQLRELIQAQAPELAQGFEELLVQLPKRKKARQSRPSAKQQRMPDESQSSSGQAGVARLANDAAPAVPIRRSYTTNAMVSLVDGSQHSDLRPHLKELGLSEDQYRQIFGLPAEYPLSWKELVDSGINLRTMEINPPSQEEVKQILEGVTPQRQALPSMEEVPIDQQVSGAYWSLTQRAQDWVPLRDLRAALPNIPRGELDAALKRMYLGQAVNLSSQDDQGSLTPADREASMQMGASRIDMLSMENPLQASEEARQTTEELPLIEEVQNRKDLRRSFADILDSKTPRSQWAKKLNITDEQLDPLIEEAIQRKWLRRDKNGNVRRVPKSQRVGNFAALAIGNDLPDIVPNEGPAVKTDAAQSRNAELQAAVEGAAAKIIPDDVRVEVVDNIEIMRLRREDELLALQAFHASPHDFAVFSSDMTGSGQGLAVHGPGLYLGSTSNVAKFFGRLIAKNKGELDGTTVNYLNMHGGDIVKTAEEIARRKNIFKGEALRALERTENVLKNQPSGYLYEAIINADSENIVIAEDPISSQPIGERLINLIGEYDQNDVDIERLDKFQDYNPFVNENGETIIPKRVEDLTGEQAIALLRTRGFDNYDFSANEIFLLNYAEGDAPILGERSYLVFDPDIVKVARQLDGMYALRRTIPEDQSNTQAFRKWFGDSKVVDENGDPLVVYHGPAEIFEAFDPGMVGSEFNQDRRGFFFIDRRPTAEGYARNTSYGLPRDEVAPVLEVYLSLQDPLIVNIDFDPINEWDERHEELQRLADDGNHDGIIIKAEKGESLYVAFEPTQIKSTANRGTFDPTDPRISYALRKTKSEDSAMLDAEQEGVSDGRFAGDRASAGTEGDALVAGQSETGLSARPGEGLPDRGVEGADARILRAESATVRDDGSIIVGRTSKADGTSTGESQPIGKTEKFSIGGFSGFVTADAPAGQSSIASAVYRIYPKGTELPSGKRVNFSKLDQPIIAKVKIDQRPDGAWEVAFVETREEFRKQGVAKELYAAIEKDLGVRMSPSGVLTADGYKFWQKRSPASVQWHVWSPVDQSYVSPNWIDRRIEAINQTLSDMGRRPFLRPIDALEQREFIAERERLVKIWRELPLEARAAKDSMFALRVFHGSPHKFDRFDSSKVGTGEGTTEQGYGLYLSDAVDQGQNYRINLGADLVELNGKAIGNDIELQQLTAAKILGENDFGQTIDDIVAGAEQALNRLREAPEPTQADADRLFTSLDTMLARYQQNIAQAESYLSKAIEVRDGDVQPGGSLYEVEIDANLDDFLKIDVPMQGQPAMEGVRKAFKAAGLDESALSQMDGREAYDALAAALGGEKQASEALANAGVAGNSYSWFGATNFVVFDDKILKILKRNGEPVSLDERQEVVDQLLAIRAFHGSPHDFDRFDISRIGTGEGAQAFGHGLYFAENEGVAEYYKEALGGALVDGQPFNDMDPLHQAAWAIADAGGSRSLASRNLAETIDKIDPEYDRPYRFRLTRAKKFIDEGYDIPKADLGQLYEVEIDVEPEQLLDWDKPLGYQSVQASTAIRKLQEINPNQFRKPEIERWLAGASEFFSVDRFYDMMRGDFGGVENLNAAFKEVGIRGIRYLDQGSRSTGEGSRNIVIFDDSLVKITKKNGEPVGEAERQSVVDDLMAMRRQPSQAQEPQALGQTDPYNMVISIAARAVEAEAAAKGVSPIQEGIRVFRHEAVEFFNAMGIFTPKEWQLLQRTAKQKGWIETTGVRDAYTNLYQQGMSAAELNDLLVKEAIAEQYSEFHLNNKQFTPAITRVFQRIKDFLTRAMNSLRGMGFQTWDDIFTKIDQGEFKQRYEQAFGAQRPSQQGGAQPIVRAGQLPDARGRQPAAQPSPVLQGISKTIRDFKRTLGMTVRQGRLDPGLKRAMKAAGAGDVVGQFSRDTGVTRLQVSNDFDTLTHEGGHHLEVKYGRGLDAIKQQFAAELNPLASPGKDQLSEGFAEFFRRYVTEPQTARLRSPGFYDAFEDFIDAQDPEFFIKLQNVQKAYDSYIQGDPTDAKMANQTVLVGRKGAFSQFMEDAEENGLRDTMADRLHVLYYDMIGKNHGFWLGTKILLDLIEQNTGKRVDLKAVDNPNKLLRRINHTSAWARQDLKNGITLQSAPNGGGVSMHDVLNTAFGSTKKGDWNESNLKSFGDYLISRRAVHLYVRHRPQLRQVVQQFVAQNPSVSYLLPRLPVNTESTLEYAPTLEPLSDHLQSLVDYEAANPQFQKAADLYYQFSKDILRFLAEKGLISSEDFTRLSVDTDYAPFQRDMSDRVLATGRQAMVKRGGEAAKANKYDVYRTIKGSTRDIINPIQSTVQFVYEMRLRAALNDTIKAMDRLASAAGTGGGAIFERLPPNEAQGYTVQIQQALKNAAKDAGMSDADTIAMLGNVEQYLGNNAATMLFTQGQAKERGERIIWFYEDGKPVPARLNDDTLGRMMFEAFTTMGKRSADLWMRLLAIPTQVVRFGVTNSFEFIFRNIFVDSFAAPVNSPYAKPLITQISGLRQILGGGQYHQLYNRYAGMMGGELTQTISDQGIDRDIRTLRDKGFKIRRPRNIPELFKMMFQVGEFSETATRVGIFKKAFESAIADGMTEAEAAAEAAFAAHDVIDFSRHGSKTEVLRRSITFMNAAMQGMDKYVRSMTAQGDRGSTWKRASKADFAAAFTPYLKYRAGTKLTANEQADLNQSAKAWAFTVLVMGGMSFTFSMLGEDDEMVDEVPDRLKATHWVVSINGAIHLLPKDIRSFLNLPEETDIIRRLPKPFEMAWVANGIERALAGARKNDPTAFNDYLKDMMEITAPPNGIPALDIPYEWMSGKNFYTGRDIIPTFEQDLERADQFGPYTSEASKAIGDAVNISPYYVDHLSRSIGASIARDIHTIIDMAVGKGPEPRTEEYPVARRFSYNVARNSQSMEKFYDLYYSSEGMKSWFWDTVSSDARSFLAAKNSYKSLVDDDKLAAADDLYQRLNPDQKVFAILGTHFKESKSRYRNLHPMENASDGVKVANKLMKEIVTGEILVGKREDKSEIDRAQAAFARNELGHIRRGFAQNALHIMKVPGWANQKMMDVDKRMATLQAGAPKIYDEFIRRLKKEKFLDFKHVSQVWPDVKERVMADRDKASLGDLVAGGAIQPNYDLVQ